MEDWILDHAVNGQAGTLLLLYVQPGGSKIAFKGLFESKPVRLKLSVCASPTESEANQLIIFFLAETLGVSEERIRIIEGESSRQKNVWISGIDSLSTQVRLDLDFE
jgi:uncharacterized protein YggU (UPF0235/DUF167 family)